MLTGESQLPVVVNVSVNGCLSLFRVSASCEKEQA